MPQKDIRLVTETFFYYEFGKPQEKGYVQSEVFYNRQGKVTKINEYYVHLKGKELQYETLLLNGKVQFQYFHRYFIL